MPVARRTVEKSMEVENLNMLMKGGGSSKMSVEDDEELRILWGFLYLLQAAKIPRTLEKEKKII